MNFKTVVLSGMVLATGVALAAAAPGNCMARAWALKGSQAVTLVNEWSPDFKEYWDMGVAWYKVTLMKGQEATIWITGGDTADLLELSAAYDYDAYMGEDDVFPEVYFDWEEFRDGGATRFITLRSEYWGAEDPASVVFYVCIRGTTVGQTCNLYFSNQIVTFTKEGEEGNPKRLTITESSQKDSQSLLEDGAFYYTARMEAGRKYSLRTTGGTAGSPLKINWEGEAPPTDPDPAYSNDTANASYLVYPTATKDYTFFIYGAGEQVANLKYWVYPARAPENHPWVELSDDNGYAASGVPGRVTANDKADRSYYDDVIDEFLTRIKLAKDERWVFETSGSTTNIEMRIYDADGNTLAVNNTLGRGSKDVRAAVAATYDGYYYIGVCNPALADWDASPTEPTVTVFARNANEFNGENDLDTFDAGDDAWTGASVLTPIPATSGDKAVSVGVPHGRHVLSGADWYDWYAIPCRSNLTYVLKAAFEEAEVTDLKLFAKVYRVVNGTLTRFTTGVRGSVTPVEADTGTMQFLFKAESNGMYYIRVNVSEGVGLDYPPHIMYAMVYGDDPLGLVKVNTKGVDGTWYFTDDASALYANGATVAVPVGTRKIRYSDDAAYTTPAKETLTIESWTATSNITETTGWYVDVADPADNVRSGATTIAPTAKERKVKRTLWADKDHADAADWFKFSAAAGMYYNFRIEDTTGGIPGGDAAFTITDGSGKALSDEVVEIRRWTAAAGTYYIKVAHATEPATDTAYRFWYDSANVGTLAFASTSVNVAESQPYVDVAVNRSASEGMVRVCFATEALTAEPGKEYYPTNGILEWANGDQTAKTIRVRLIPDLVDAYDEQKKFKVNIWPVANDGLKVGEYPATIVGATFATVKIKESTAQNPGTVVATSPDPLEVVAGETLKVKFSRVDGSDGAIAVKVKTQSSTAIMGTDGSADFDYAKATLEWADGETGDKEFEVKTTACTAPGEDKQMRLKLSTLATGAYAGNLTPRLAASKIYIPIRNPINAGTIVAVSPDPRQVVAGETLKVVFRRTEGSNGAIAVKVKTQSSTAIMGTDGSADFDYAKATLEWADGETGDKEFEVKTTACKTFAENKQLRLKLSTLATGAYAGNLTPKLAESKIYFTIWNQLAPASAAGGPVAKIASGTDAYGNAIDVDNPIELVKGVYSNIKLGAETGGATTCKLVQGELPPGMSTYKLRVYGTPTAAGDYKALVQVFNGNVGGTSIELNFHVADADLAFGTFSGVLAEDGDPSLTNRMPRLGSLSFTASATGSLSAKVKVGASSYVFTGSTGYDAVSTNDLPAGIDRYMGVALQNVVQLGSVNYTNLLTLSVADGSSTNGAALGTSAGTVALTLNVLDGLGGVQEEINYTCDLLRDNSGLEVFEAALTGFAGYYTLALVPEGVALKDGVPAGNGYLTVTVGDDGVAKCAGLLADGTEISCSGSVALRGDLATPEDCTLLLPVFQKTSPYSFGGVAILKANGTFDSRTALEWNKDGKASSYDRQGFSLSILPTGGWYDTVKNLQTYYLNREFTVEAEPVTGLPADMLPSGNYTIDSTPHGVAAQIDINNLVLPSRTLVMDEKHSSLIDFAASINPWKVKMSFTRATGIVTGTFQAFSITSTKSTSIGTFNHHGVLLMNRDDASPLDTDVWTAGFGLMPVTSYWTLSIPFNIRSIAVDPDWSEVSVPGDD